MTGPISLPKSLSESLPDRWRLKLATAANMRPEQLAGVAERRLRHAVVPSLPVDFDSRYERRIPADLPIDSEPLSRNTAMLRASLTDDERTRYRDRLEAVREGRFTFLNRSLTFEDPASIEWDHDRLDEFPRLWRLKLHGFVPISWAIFGSDEIPDDLDSLFRSWIRDWLESHPIGDDSYLRAAWTPYAVSLRLIYWCRYLAWRETSEPEEMKNNSKRNKNIAFSETERPDDFDRLLRRGIHKHAAFLRNHLERDVGGNHLVENGAALVVAGTLDAGRNRGWLDEGVAVLREAAETQFLEDGGHFERSPMYHVLTLERYLTAIDLLDRIGYPVPGSVRATAAAATRFVSALRPPDDRIPLLNDAVFGQALSIPAVLDYAERVGVIGDADALAPLSASGNTALSASGYYWLSEGEDRLLVDGGPSGPRHLPGHAHNDFLQVLLWVGGRRLITDTGVFHYAPDEYRENARSVRSHNTVQVDDLEPVEIGGRYLRGRRTRPTVAFERRGDQSMFVGQYDTRSRFRRGYEHRRRVLHRPSWWLVWDDIEVNGASGIGGAEETGPTTIHDRIHLAPEVHVERESDARFGLSLDDATCWVYPLNAAETVCEETDYYPEFGVAERRPTLGVQTRCESEGHVGYLVSTDRFESVEIDWSASEIDGLRLDEQYERVPSVERLQERPVR